MVARGVESAKVWEVIARQVELGTSTINKLANRLGRKRNHAYA